MVDRTQRPVVPVEWKDAAEHRRRIADRANACVPKDGSEAMQQPFPLKAYAKADLPDAADWPYAMVYVTDETGGATAAISNGTNWQRVTDLATVS